MRNVLYHAVKGVFVNYLLTALHFWESTGDYVHVEDIWTRTCWYLPISCKVELVYIIHTFHVFFILSGKPFVKDLFIFLYLTSESSVLTMYIRWLYVSTVLVFLFNDPHQIWNTRDTNLLIMKETSAEHALWMAVYKEVYILGDNKYCGSLFYEIPT